MGISSQNEGMTLEQRVISAFETYSKQTGLSVCTIGHHVANSGSFYDRLKRGGGLTARTYERARAWFEERGVRFDELGKDTAV